MSLRQSMISQCSFYDEAQSVPLLSKTIPIWLHIKGKEKGKGGKKISSKDMGEKVGQIGLRRFYYYTSKVVFSSKRYRWIRTGITDNFPRIKKLNEINTCLFRPGLRLLGANTTGFHFNIHSKLHMIFSFEVDILS